MRTVTTERSGTSVVPHDTTHQQVIFAADSLNVAITLIAPTEGQTRFIANSVAHTSEPQRGIPGALARLGEQCGYPVSDTMTTAAVVSGPPLRMHVIGERGAADATALEAVERSGIAEIIASPALPPRRSERDTPWFRPAIEALRDGGIEALLVVIPPGALPLWAAQILTALGEITPTEDALCVILASDADLADVVPTGATLVVRDDHLVTRLARALNRIRAGRLLPGLPATTPVMSRSEALVAAARTMQAAGETPCVFVDVSDGTTIIVADARATIVHHDAEIDVSHGAPALVHRCGHERITRWLPSPIEERALHTWAVRRASRPGAPRVDRHDLLIASALARAALIHVMETHRIALPDTAHWIVGPALAQLASPSATVRLVADLLSASGVAVVIRDVDDLFATVGALSIPHPADAADLLARDGQIPLGSVVRATIPRDRRGGAGRATLVSDDRTWQADVAANALTTIACRGAATVTIHESNPSVEKVVVHGGAAGIVIDTRRRPLDAAATDMDRPSVSERLRPASATEGAAHD